MADFEWQDDIDDCVIEDDDSDNIKKLKMLLNGSIAMPNFSESYSLIENNCLELETMLTFSLSIHKCCVIVGDNSSENEMEGVISGLIRRSFLTSDISPALLAPEFLPRILSELRETPVPDSFSEELNALVTRFSEDITHKMINFDEHIQKKQFAMTNILRSICFVGRYEGPFFSMMSLEELLRFFKENGDNLYIYLSNTCNKSPAIYVSFGTNEYESIPKELDMEPENFMLELRKAAKWLYWKKRQVR